MPGGDDDIAKLLEGGEDEDNEDFEDGSRSQSEEEAEEEEEMLARPVFVPKSQRGADSSKSFQEIVTEEEAERRIREDAKRKEQTRALLAETLRRSELTKDYNEDDNDSNAGLPGDISDYDDDVEYEAWKLRELQRLKRDAEEREADMIEKAEVLRRRGMTDEERMEEDRKLGLLSADEARQNKPKMKFLQRYYHKGAFYMDVDSVRSGSDVREKDYNAPTLGDSVDKERLPQVMQVKNFGKRGRTKYTHLVDQDTTMQGMKRVDVRPDRQAMESYLGKRGGARDT